MSNIIEEGNLRFDFTACDALEVEEFDKKEANIYGMKAVDFFAETAKCLYFIEVKDFQHPNPNAQNQKQKNYVMLTKPGTKEHDEFILGMGEKIKDSLLRKYAEGYSFTKKVKYLLFINLDLLGENERGRIREKISGHVPTGLNDARFNAFTEITFDLVNKQKLMQYTIVCQEIIP